MKKAYNEFDVRNCKGVSLGDCRMEKEDGALVSSKMEIQEIQKLLQENRDLTLILRLPQPPPGALLSLLPCVHAQKYWF